MYRTSLTAKSKYTKDKPGKWLETKIKIVYIYIIYKNNDFLILTYYLKVWYSVLDTN